LAETTVGSFKNELIRRQGPWRDVNQVEIATAQWVLWFNTERPHEYLDDFTPEARRETPLRSQTHPTESGVIQHNQSPDSPGRLTFPVNFNCHALQGNYVRPHSC
jgi:Integrase core domain